MHKNDSSERCVSEETITLPLRIPHPYSSSNQWMPHPHLSIPQFSIIPIPAPRIRPQSSLLQASLSVYQLHVSPPTPDIDDSTGQSSLSQNACSSTNITDDHLPYSNPSNHAASQIMLGESIANSSNHLLLILTNLSNLSGSLNSLCEELAETCNTISTMNHQTSAASESHIWLSRHSSYKALPTPCHKNQSHADMMVSEKLPTWTWSTLMIYSENFLQSIQDQAEHPTGYGHHNGNSKWPAHGFTYWCQQLWQRSHSSSYTDFFLPLLEQYLLSLE